MSDPGDPAADRAASLTAVRRTASTARTARLRHHEAIRSASQAGLSLRSIATAAACSPEQVRRILDGRAT